jgi:outer membrane protein TolC
MRSHHVAIPALLSITGCAGAAGARAHDAMVAELQSLERERPAQLAEDLALGAPALDRATLVAAVLARNPELDRARETWRAAAAAYPSAVAIADPMLTYEVAPFSITGDVPFGQRVQVTQKLPYPGRLPLAGEAVLADADAARADYGLVRLQLAEAAVDAFDDYYVAARALDVNAHHRGMLEQIQHSATAQYSVGHAAQQDPLEAEGELIALDRERLMLDAQAHAAAARINRLLRRRPDAPLPPPPDTLEIAAPSPGAGALDPRAAATARIRARAAELTAAERASYPDLEVMGSYDSMWGDWQHRVMVGIAIELPVSRGGRRGAVERARAALAGAAAELGLIADTLAEGRAGARRDVDEATAALALYERRAVPNARARVDAALAGFTAGQASLAMVMTAERALREIELATERARADLDRRIATLDRLAGRIAGGGR